MREPTTAEIMLSARNFALEDAAKLCDAEADACAGDVVPGDDIGKLVSNARVGALLTAAGDIRKLIKN